MGTGVVLNVPGSGWPRLAAHVAAAVPVEQIDGVWVFKAIRHEGREWGTALISRVDGERRRIYTGRFVHTLKGKERGRFEATLDEVGSGPIEALSELLAGVQKRMDEEPPTPVRLEDWFPPAPPPADGPPRSE